MATLLYRLGRFSFRRRGRIAALWLLLLTLLGVGAATLMGPTSDKFSMPGTESQRALDDLDRQFPQAGGATGTIVVAASEGEKLNPAAVAPVVKEASGIHGVTAAMDPFRTGAVSPDGRYALIQVQFDKAADEVTDETKADYQAVGDDVEGLRVEHGGEVMGGEVEIGSTEALGVLVAAVVLVITFGSLVAAGMTLLNALIGVAVGMAGLFSLTSVIELTSTAPILALMLGLAVGIDYSLFITSRYRQYLAEGLQPEEAAGRATGTAGSAVVFAGATVVIALAGLSVVGIPFLSVMGLAAAGTVAVAVLVALTLLPAFLSFAGKRILSRKQRHAGGYTAGDGTVAEGFGFTWGRLVVKLRVPLLVVGILGLGALTLPAQDMRIALPDAGTAAEGSPAREAYDLTSEGFGEGFNGRLIAVVNGEDVPSTRAAAEKATALIKDTDGILTVAPPQLNEQGTTALLAIIPEAGPTAAATEDAVHDIRARVTDVEGADIALTGATALGIDVSEKLADALPVYLLLVVGLSILLLMLVFRSVLVPLKAALGFLLTVGATFGITVAIFQEGHLAGLVGVDTPGPLVSFLPILLIGILFGLAMDYEVFLVSRMREDFVHGADPQAAMVSGMGHNARVVTAAALIMTSVFGGFVLMDDPIIKSIGFALAVGVVIDAFVVRMALVPAVMSLLGRAAWWLPKPVDKALPDLDIEGEKLNRQLAAETREEIPVSV
ncbi:MMPL family transporter [Streptomyces griseoloalbus]|uniref:RND superfamily putative drug exporter n=1 Tax=Streptomyces griseoloalbus TaxID=67303 RepID=A0A7W8BT98_9ACTN|nr:MMPL family transporter [Streptomyces albaduncus]MBB5129232.1 RND superfamily putative drug exporter [Streptomyces albaduncus]GGV81500.1 membrane protein [Streptomyces griseoloalbus]GGW65351.1 membrane protein [Streptomyces albaduncus]